MQIFNHISFRIPKFFKKDDEKRYPEGDFRISRIISEEGVLFSTINHSYLEYQKKNLFPWQLKISIEKIICINNKVLTKEEMKILKFIENSIKKFLQKNNIAHYIGRVTKKGSIEIYFYLDKPILDCKKTKCYLEEFSDLRNIECRLKKDENWRDLYKLIA